jgi:hypothetical protein
MAIDPFPLAPQISPPQQILSLKTDQAQKWLLFQPFQKEKEKGKRKEKEKPKMAVIKRLSIRRLTNSILAVKMWKIARERERQREAKKFRVVS